MTLINLCTIIDLMEKKNIVRKILQHPIFSILSLGFSVFMVWYIYTFRVINHGAFKVADLMSLALLLLCLLDVLFAYYDKESDLKGLIKETLPAYFFFIAFLITKFLFRG